MRFFLSLICILALNSAINLACAEPPSLYTLEGLNISVNAESPAAARDMAIIEAQKKGLSQLLKRLGGEEAAKLASAIKPEALANYVRDFEITRERTSAKGYRGTFTLRFQPEAVRNLLSNKNINFSEKVSRPLLVLPMLRQGTRLVLFEEITPWHEAWQSPLKNNNETALIVPLLSARGDLDDVQKLSAAEAAGGDGDALDALAKTYEAGGTLVVLAEANGEGDTPLVHSKPLTLSWQRLDVGHNTLLTESITLEAAPDKTLAEWLAGGRKELLHSVSQVWRQQNLGQQNSGRDVQIILAVGTLNDWLEKKALLENLPEIEKIELQALASRNVWLRVTPRYDFESLALSLKSFDFDLQPVGQGAFKLVPLLASPSQAAIMDANEPTR